MARAGLAALDRRQVLRTTRSRCAPRCGVALKGKLGRLAGQRLGLAFARGVDGQRILWLGLLRRRPTELPICLDETDASPDCQTRPSASAPPHRAVPATEPVPPDNTGNLQAPAFSHSVWRPLPGRLNAAAIACHYGNITGGTPDALSPLPWRRPGRNGLGSVQPQMESDRAGKYCRPSEHRSRRISSGDELEPRAGSHWHSDAARLAVD